MTIQELDMLFFGVTMIATILVICILIVIDAPLWAGLSVCFAWSASLTFMFLRLYIA